MGKLPYFPFYVKDWLSSPSIAMMTTEQRGVYIQLLAHCWNDPQCSLPADEDKLMKLSGLVSNDPISGAKRNLREVLNVVRTMFVKHPKDVRCVTNARLFEEWTKLQRQHDKYVQAGRLSGQARRNTAKSRRTMFERRSKDVGARLEPGLNKSESESDTDSEEDKKIANAPVARRVDDLEEVINFLNEKTGRKYRLRDVKGKLTANGRLIQHRLESGVTLNEIRAVIAQKCRDWMKDPKMRPYLRPETLFGATKFESYLGEVGSHGE